MNPLSGRSFNTPRFFSVAAGPIRGMKIYMAPRHGIKKFLGFYEPQLINSFKRLVKKGDTCIDVGSHVGYISLVLRKMAGPDGKVIAIEALEEGCKLLEKSLKKNGFENVFIEHSAVGEKSKKMKAHVFEDSAMLNFHDSGLDIYEKEEGANYFETKSLDDILNKHGLEKVDFIKIDIEGYEGNALLGAKETIEKYKPKFLIEIHTKENYSKCWGILNNAGYKIADLNKKDLDENYSGNSDIFHIIALPK